MRYKLQPGSRGSRVIGRACLHTDTHRQAERGSRSEIVPLSLQQYLSSKKGSMVLISLIILCFISVTIIIYSYKDLVYATGGAFPYTKHGGGMIDTDGNPPYDVGNGPGVDRSINPDYPGYYNDQSGEAGKYMAGECTHCHEPHASFGGSEPLPNTPPDDGPDKYLLMKDYGTTTSYAELCWYCHDNMININGSGYGNGYGRWGFYQGSAVYQSSSHYNASTFYWPGTTGDPVSIWPRQDRSGLPPGNLGSCLNCHTPHGIKAATAGSAYDTTSPDGTGGVPANRQTFASGNPSIPSANSDYLIPRQLIAWEEMLCENCHDGTDSPSPGPSTKDIQTEINKRYQATGSGHPVDDTGLAGRHVVSETLPVTETPPGSGIYDPNKKHVECYDCHNPHADNSANRLEGMKYIDINGIVQDPATGARQPYVHEVCIKCHGESHNSFIPDKTATGTPVSGKPLRTTIAQYGCAIVNPASGCTDGSNKRLEFNSATDADLGAGAIVGSGNRGYHPVDTVGRNTSTAMDNQLLGGLLSSNTIQCTDCHNTEATGTTQGPITESNATRATDISSQYTGVASLGTHGSIYPRILRANYDTSFGTITSSPFLNFNLNNFDLCFLCHDVSAFTDTDGLDTLLNPLTNFRQDDITSSCTNPVTNRNLHAVHINSAGPSTTVFTSCSNCHYNIHSNVEAANTLYGDGTGGALPPNDIEGATNADTHLIDFSPMVEPAGSFKPKWWYDTANSVLRCDLTCHNVTHSIANNNDCYDDYQS